MDACDGPVGVQISGIVNTNTPGAYPIIYTATDVAGNTTTTTRTVQVADTTPPEISVSTEPITLWPPNHKYQTVALDDVLTGVIDACDTSVSVVDVLVTSAGSDEPENGQGDGNTTGDIVIGSDCRSVDLRAERQGGGNGRVYTLNLATIDESDNIGRTGYQVHVPHNKKSVAIDDGSVFTVGGCDLVLPRSQTAATSIQPETAGLAPEEIPATYRLEQNYPNPFNPTTEITFDLPEAVHVLLEVYDVTGRRVARLVDTQMPAGQHRVTFDAARLPSGVYLYRLTAGSFSRSHHMVLTK